MFRRALVVMAAVLAASAFHAVAARAATESVTIDGAGAGRTLDGVGGISAQSSRLLVDYPEPERSRILDYLFKPHYGASLQTLKVEIGGDSTWSEASHMRMPDELDCNRGYEWWLMEQAKERNPNIKLYGLMWTSPGWLTAGLWGQPQVDYLVNWLRCAAQHGLRIDYLGGGNERQSYKPAFFSYLHDALATEFPNVKVVATDSHVPDDLWRVARDLRAKPWFDDVVDVVGEHDPCGWRTIYAHCYVSDDALALDDPLWASETSVQDTMDGAGPLARAMNRDYIDGRITANIVWPAASANYGTWGTTGGLIDAAWPWSGHYLVGKTLWVTAHTTQFTQSGWRYLDDASGYLDTGASYVTLRSPDSGDYSTVIETMDATEPGTVDFHVGGGLSTQPVQIWDTDVDSDDPHADFRHAGAVPVSDGSFEVRLEPHHVYTLTTTTGQHKGRAEAPSGPDARMALPYHEDFERARPDVAQGIAPLFADLNGAFERAPCQGRREGTCYRQLITQAPAWASAGGRIDPATVVGDPRWWGDYEVSADAELEESGYVELLGRIEVSETGYHLRVDDGGAWSLYWQRSDDSEVELASGQMGAPFGIERWHRLSMRFQGDDIAAAIDGTTVAHVADDRSSTGQVGLRVSQWKRAEFDDVDVTPTGPAPEPMTRTHMSATATSVQPGPYEHHFYTGAMALDGRPRTQWMTAMSDGVAPLPQSLTIELGGGVHDVYGLAYKPPIGNDRAPYSGIVTGYTIAVSRDGRRFTEVASGSWQPDISTKLVTWPSALHARYVRLEATSADGGVAGASEVDILKNPFAEP